MGEGGKGMRGYTKKCGTGLIASMPRRCAAVVEAKGGHTKY